MVSILLVMSNSSIHLSKPLGTFLRIIIMIIILLFWEFFSLASADGLPLEFEWL